MHIYIYAYIGFGIEWPTAAALPLTPVHGAARPSPADGLRDRRPGIAFSDDSGQRRDAGSTVLAVRELRLSDATVAAWRPITLPRDIENLTPGWARSRNGPRTGQNGQSGQSSGVGNSLLVVDTDVATARARRRAGTPHGGREKTPDSRASRPSMRCQYRR